MQNYLDRETCEDQSGKPPNATCRKVDVDGGRCALVRVSRRGGKLVCEQSPLYYLEDGIKKTIAPPEDYELTCRAKTLIRAEAFKLWRDEDNGTTHDLPPPETYCSCGRDSEDASICQVVRISAGSPSVLASAGRPKDAQGCTREVCNVLFNQADFRSQCPAYVPGEP